MITNRDLELARRSLLYRSNSNDSICETLRLIADKIYDCQNPELKKAVMPLLIKAFAMSKKMNARLIYYHNTYKDNTGKAGKGSCFLPNSRANRRMRAERELIDE